MRQPLAQPQPVAAASCWCDDLAKYQSRISATIRRRCAVGPGGLGYGIGGVGDDPSSDLEGNDISGNVRGVSILAGASPTLRANVICGNELNLNLVEGADAVFEENEICVDGASSEAP